MPALLSSKTVTARKPHRCSCCGAVAILPGQTYKREALAYDGHAYTWVSCADCQRLTMEVWDWSGCPDEGINSDDYLTWAEDHRLDPDRGLDARAFLTRYHLNGEHT